MRRGYGRSIPLIGIFWPMLGLALACVVLFYAVIALAVGLALAIPGAFLWAIFGGGKKK